MARGSSRSTFVALLAAAGTGAAQLGLGYGLGIISWASTPGGAASGIPDTIAPGAWASGLIWATWLTATSVVVGAVVGDRMRGNTDQGVFARAASRLAIALAATLGSLVVLPLVGVPVSAAHIGGNSAPHLLIGIYAATGAVIGLVISLVAMSSRAVAANVFVTAGWLWVLAVIAVSDGRANGRGVGYAQLGVWKFTAAGPTWNSYYIPGALLMLSSALLVGGLAAFAAAGRGDGRFGVSISGLAGPLIVLAAYLLARPVSPGSPAELVSAYYTAPYMVIAGLAGSVLVAAVGGGFRRTVPERRAVAVEPEPPVEAGVPSYY